MLDIGARAAWLMRSPAFRSLSPEGYVSRWERDYRAWVIDGSVRRFRESFDQTRDLLGQGLVVGNREDRVMARLFARWAGLERDMGAWRLRRVLERYHGDISCYADTSGNAG